MDGNQQGRTWREIILPRIPDELGDLCFGEGERHIPFVIKRFYFVIDIPAHAKRGGHAHKKTSQVVFALRGGFSMDLENGREQSTVRLDSPEKGLLIGPMVWKRISNYAPDSICLAVASELFEENDYIRDYADFLSALEGTF